MKALKLFLLLALAAFPSFIKISILRAFGARIGKGCRIGLSVIDAQNIEIGDHVRIGHFNFIWRLKKLEMGTGSKIGDGNWITGAGSGEFLLGKNSSIRRFHFLEASGSIRIGKNSILAGRGTQLFTHGLHPDKFDDVRPIVIGDWCYVGALSRFVPGASLNNGTFVGMGSVVTKEQKEEYVLIAGNPATKKKDLSRESEYFKKGFLHHEHHPVEYEG